MGFYSFSGRPAVPSAPVSPRVLRLSYAPGKSVSMIPDTEPPSRQRSGTPVFSSPRPARHVATPEGDMPRVTSWAGGGTARMASASGNRLTSVGIDVIATHAQRSH